MAAKTHYTEQTLTVATDLFDGHLREFGELDLAACSLYVEEITGYKVEFANAYAGNCPTSPSVPLPPTSALPPAINPLPHLFLPPSTTSAVTQTLPPSSALTIHLPTLPALATAYNTPPTTKRKLTVTLRNSPSYDHSHQNNMPTSAFKAFQSNFRSSTPKPSSPLPEVASHAPCVRKCRMLRELVSDLNLSPCKPFKRTRRQLTPHYPTITNTTATTKKITSGTPTKTLALTAISVSNEHQPLTTPLQQPSDNPTAPLCVNTACKNYTGAPCRYCANCHHDCTFEPHIHERIRSVYFFNLTSAYNYKNPSKSSLIYDKKILQADILSCISNPTLHAALLELQHKDSYIVTLPTPTYAKHISQTQKHTATQRVPTLSITHVVSTTPTISTSITTVTSSLAQTTSAAATTFVTSTTTPTSPLTTETSTTTTTTTTTVGTTTTAITIPPLSSSTSSASYPIVTGKKRNTKDIIEYRVQYAPGEKGSWLPEFTIRHLRSQIRSYDTSVREASRLASKAHHSALALAEITKQSSQPNTQPTQPSPYAIKPLLPTPATPPSTQPTQPSIHNTNLPTHLQELPLAVSTALSTPPATLSMHALTHTVATTTPSLHSESFPDNGTVIELLLKQKKNMRVSYRARVVNGQPRWILEKDLLPKYSALVRDFNAKQLANVSTDDLVKALSQSAAKVASKATKAAAKATKAATKTTKTAPLITATKPADPALSAPATAPAPASIVHVITASKTSKPPIVSLLPSIGLAVAESVTPADPAVITPRSAELKFASTTESKSEKPFSKPTKPIDISKPIKHSTKPLTAEREPGALPPFLPMSAPTFQWAEGCDGKSFIDSIEVAYEITTKWRKNTFKLPSGSSGKLFTKALTRLYEAYGQKSPLECIALKAAAVITPLLLQQPSGKPTYRESAVHLLRRLKLWDEGKIGELISECKTIQAQLSKSSKVMNDTTLAKRFATMIFNNNYKGAMSLVTSKGKGGVHVLDAKTKESMKAKHPKPAALHEDALHSGPLPTDMHPIFYSALDGEMIRKHTLRTTGGAGISQQEDNLWHKMITAHKESSASLANSLAAVARRLSTEYVDPMGLEALLANRGIAIDKCPGFRPVGVGEIARRIIGKAVMEVTGKCVQESTGALQLCAGQPVGVEAAIHTMRSFLDDDSRKKNHQIIQATSAQTSTQGRPKSRNNTTVIQLPGKIEKSADFFYPFMWFLCVTNHPPSNY